MIKVLGGKISASRAALPLASSIIHADVGNCCNHQTLALDQIELALLLSGHIVQDFVCE